MNETTRTAIDRIVEASATAWNTGDWTAFGAPFRLDADFVNIFAMHLAGRDAIARQHQMIFDGSSG